MTKSLMNGARINSHTQKHWKQYKRLSEPMEWLSAKYKEWRSNGREDELSTLTNQPLFPRAWGELLSAWRSPGWVMRLLSPTTTLITSRAKSSSETPESRKPVFNSEFGYYIAGSFPPLSLRHLPKAGWFKGERRAPMAGQGDWGRQGERLRTLGSWCVRILRTLYTALNTNGKLNGNVSGAPNEGYSMYVAHVRFLYSSQHPLPCP